jgi:predicted nucleotidyltransferase
VTSETNGVGRKPKDRDFLRTREGMFFCVTGYLHPPDRYTAYLKYSPTSAGKWVDGETAYRRELSYYHVRNVAKTIGYLEQQYPEYVYDCPVRGFKFSMVPRDHVARYYVPEERLQEILRGPGDSLEEEVRGLALDLTASAGIDATALGVTGSILIGVHNPEFSDMDLTVYGLDSAKKVRQALRNDRVRHVRPLGESFIARWARGIAGRFPLTVEEARYLAGRRWNYGTYDGRYFSIHAIRSNNEIGERYGDHIYTGHGGALLRAVVVDASEALFMPAIYRVEGVQLLEGNPRASKVEEIVSYEGLYRNAAEAGNVVEARGKLESVDGEARRLVIGTMEMGGEGYVKLAGKE